MRYAVKPDEPTRYGARRPEPSVKPAARKQHAPSAHFPLRRYAASAYIGHRLRGMVPRADGIQTMTTAELFPKATAEQIAELNAAARGVFEAERAIREGRAGLAPYLRAAGRWERAQGAAQ